LKNRVFEALVALYAEEAETQGLTRKEVAERLKRDPAVVSRWLRAPSNLTLDTISDLLLAVGAEMDVRFVRFADRVNPNEMHDLVAEILSETEKKPRRRLNNPNSCLEGSEAPASSGFRVVTAKAAA
jgi:transcriptional regulator with XRE-family HTH domain